MHTFEWIIALLLGAAALAALATGSARRTRPFWPSAACCSPSFPPARTGRWTRLALTLFVAPVLLDAA